MDDGACAAGKKEDWAGEERDEARLGHCADKSHQRAYAAQDRSMSRFRELKAPTLGVC